MTSLNFSFTLLKGLWNPFKKIIWIWQESWLPKNVFSVLVLPWFLIAPSKNKKVIYICVHRLLLALTKQQIKKCCVSLWRTGREQQRYSQLGKTGPMRNVEWNQPPRFYHASCQKEERRLAGSSVLPTHTSARAGEVRFRMRHRLEYSQWFHAKWWCCEWVTFLWKVPSPPWPHGRRHLLTQGSFEAVENIPHPSMQPD